MITRVDDLEKLPPEDLALATKFAVAVWCGEFGDDATTFNPPNTTSFANVFNMQIAKSYDIIVAARNIGIKIEM